MMIAFGNVMICHVLEMKKKHAISSALHFNFSLSPNGLPNAHGKFMTEGVEA